VDLLLIDALVNQPLVGYGYGWPRQQRPFVPMPITWGNRY
jgi:hypothetical protein